MERIIASSSRKGDVVSDPFAGCGTTLVVSEILQRKWVGIDISLTAVELMRRRMAKVGVTSIKLVGMPVSEAQLRALKPFEFQKLDHTAVQWHACPTSVR